LLSARMPAGLATFSRESINPTQDLLVWWTGAEGAQIL